MDCGESSMHFLILFTISALSDRAFFVIHLLSRRANAQLDLGNTPTESKSNIYSSPPSRLIKLLEVQVYKSMNENDIVCCSHLRSIFLQNTTE